MVHVPPSIISKETELIITLSLPYFLRGDCPAGDHDEHICSELYDLIPNTRLIPRAPSGAVGQRHVGRDSSESEVEQGTVLPPAAGGADPGEDGEEWMLGEAEDQMPDNARLTKPSTSLGRSFSLGARQPKEQKEELRERLGVRSEVSTRSHVQLEQLRQEYALQRGGSVGSKASGSYTSLTSLEGWLPNGEGAEVSMEDIVSVLRHVGRLRGNGQLLLPHERVAYAKVSVGPHE